MVWHPRTLPDRQVVELARARDEAVAGIAAERARVDSAMQECEHLASEIWSWRRKYEAASLELVETHAWLAHARLRFGTWSAGGSGGRALPGCECGGFSRGTGADLRLASQPSLRRSLRSLDGIATSNLRDRGSSRQAGEQLETSGSPLAGCVGQCGEGRPARMAALRGLEPECGGLGESGRSKCCR